MAIGEWFVLALACAAGVIGLLLAASNDGGGTYHIGLGLFIVAVVYAFVFIKRHFDRIDRTPH
jgi:membrane protein implicated in regulation of membrane protease activity